MAVMPLLAIRSFKVTTGVSIVDKGLLPYTSTDILILY